MDGYTAFPLIDPRGFCSEHRRAGKEAWWGLDLVYMYFTTKALKDLFPMSWMSGPVLAGMRGIPMYCHGVISKRKFNFLGPRFPV